MEMHITFIQQTHRITQWNILLMRPCEKWMDQMLRIITRAKTKFDRKLQAIQDHTIVTSLVKTIKLHLYVFVVSDLKLGSPSRNVAKVKLLQT